MCLSIPSRIVNIDEHNNACIDTMGVQRTINLDLMPEPVKPGDYVLLHVGFAIAKISEEDAQATLQTYGEIIDAMEAAEKQDSP